MTSRYPYLYRAIQGIAGLLILLNFIAPVFLQQTQLLIAVLLIVLIGIPHGATDYLIFKNLSRPLWGGKKMNRFYFNYLLLMLAYACLWWLLPGLALGVFVLLSIYHFGQSNWNYVEMNRKWESFSVYNLWGSFVVLTPILWHFEDSVVIIESIIGSSVPVLPAIWLQAFCLSLFILNIWVSIYYYLQGKVNRKEMIDELVNLGVLGLLFICTPLLLGFAIYFVFWHALSSVMDQVQFFRERKGDAYSWKHYVKNALPLSLVAICGLAMLVGLQASMSVSINIGVVFVFISVVTLPHMIMIDQLYQELGVDYTH
jgi:Brp/Blh family beta-carotene 15,15'-monooxygenase